MRLTNAISVDDDDDDRRNSYATEPAG